MGHESRIELWSPNLTAVLFAGFGTNRLRCDEAMKTADREPKSLGQNSQQPSTWRGSSAQILLNQAGCEARKTPADGGVFFLDFPFYRTLPGLRSFGWLACSPDIARNVHLHRQIRDFGSCFCHWSSVFKRALSIAGL
jgi:hypothetical protein